MIKDITRLRNPSHRGIISSYGPIAVICWYPTWVSAVAIPQKKLLLYYIENPRHLRRHAKIHKPLEDVIMEIAKRGKPYKQGDQPGEALEDPSEELSGGRSRKRKNYTVNGAPKKHKA